MGPEEKLFLGWLDTQRGGRRPVRRLHPAAPRATPRSNDAVLVNLPDSQGHHTTYNEPYAGAASWYSGSQSTT